MKRNNICKDLEESENISCSCNSEENGLVGIEDA